MNITVKPEPNVEPMYDINIKNLTRSQVLALRRWVGGMPQTTEWINKQTNSFMSTSECAVVGEFIRNMFWAARFL